MLLKMDKYTIIKLKEEGKSFRQIARDTGIDRKTVSKYWIEYVQSLAKLNSNDFPEVVQEQIVNNRHYDASNRTKRKYSTDIDTLIDEILEQEHQKMMDLGIRHKQRLTNRQIHQLIRKQGYDIGLTVIGEVLREKRSRVKECFIRQDYELGQRLEYDFGEVKLFVHGSYRVYYLAVLTSPASKFRWAYLYNSQNKSVFLDSHVRFFEMVKGVYQEVVYDNMKNVVTKFIGKHEKLLNTDLINLSLYYGFRINVTNCYHGNEKGFVESSVKKIRNELFALKYRFSSEKEAREYLEKQLYQMNRVSMIEQEKKALLPYRPMLDLAKVTLQKVNSYSFIQVNQSFYSVPDYLVGHEVSVHVTVHYVRIYSHQHLVVTHEKVDGFHAFQIDLGHYLDTFLKKPGALPNALALKVVPRIKAIYDTYFTHQPREFIGLLKKHSNLSMQELENSLLREVNQVSPPETINHIQELTKLQLNRLNQIYQLKKEEKVYAD